jgi:hypothetical protein
VSDDTDFPGHSMWGVQTARQPGLSDKPKQLMFKASSRNKTAFPFNPETRCAKHSWP